MEKKTGIVISSGMAIGRIRVYEEKNFYIKDQKAEDPGDEIRRFQAAKEAAICHLHEISEKSEGELGKDGVKIFQAHAMILEDIVFNEQVETMILEQSVSAEYAVKKTGENLAGLFENLDDEVFRMRSMDIRDAAEQIIQMLHEDRKEDLETEEDPETKEDLPKEESFSDGKEAVILAAKELTAEKLLQMDRKKLRAVILENGAKGSHLAILLKMMGIPCIGGMKISNEWDGGYVIVDGYEGVLICGEEEQLTEMYAEICAEHEKQENSADIWKEKASMTKSGQIVNVFANISGEKDLEMAVQNGAEGIGLFRSEFLYLESEDWPSEEAQFQVYKKVLEKMNGKRVIIRTLDIGADKQKAYMGMKKEDNPALGGRGIRFCLEHPEIFRMQLRALFRAGVYGNLSILYPLIVSAEEIRKIKAFSEGVREELKREGIPTGHVEEGIMIETPAAALLSGELAKEVDFFSIGTNDLTQYTLAADRQSAERSVPYDPHHPAVQALIQMTAENGRKAGIRVGICGEIGADLTMTETLLNMGIREFSVSPGDILLLKKKICECG